MRHPPTCGSRARSVSANDRSPFRASRPVLKLQDLTRISNCDYADVRGFPPCAAMAPTARRVSHLFVQRPRAALIWFPEVVHSQPWLVARGGISVEERSGGSAPSVASVSPFVCTAGLLGSGGSGICDERAFGCPAIGRASQDTSTVRLLARQSTTRRQFYGSVSAMRRKGRLGKRQGHG